MSKFELLSNPRIGVALLPAERAAAEYLAGGYPINLVVPFVASRRKDRIQAPALGIFNKITPQYRLPYYWYLDPARQEEFNRNIESLAKWIEGAIQRFRSGVKNARVIELHDTNHYVFVVDEALVVREMRKFLLEE